MANGPSRPWRRGDLLATLAIFFVLAISGHVIWRYGHRTAFPAIEPEIAMDVRALGILQAAKQHNELKTWQHDVYSFHKVRRSFNGRTPWWRSSEFKRPMFEHLIIQTMPTEMAELAKPHFRHVLQLSEKYQVDPVWILSVMWTESHFNPHALSPKSAFGLMQLMPDTAQYLSQQLEYVFERPFSTNKTKDNIEMGIFYLRWLLDRFGGNYTLATVAYNMGPYWVTNRLRQGAPVGISNQYLNKIVSNYQVLVGAFDALVAQRKFNLQDTLVVLNTKRESYIAHHWSGLMPWFNDKNSLRQIVIALSSVATDQSRGQL